MIYSMTAYTEQEIPLDWGLLRWEIKSVNHRYLEISFKIPDWARELEIPLREVARNKLGRGKVDCLLEYRLTNNANNLLNVDFSLAERIIELVQKIHVLSPEITAATISPLEILKWPNVMKPPSIDFASIHEKMMLEFDTALDNLLKTRSNEGNLLANLIKERVDRMGDLIKKIRNRLPEVLSQYRERILAKLKPVALELDTNRLEQEMVYAATKLDVDEEIDRFSTHIVAIQNCIREGGLVGRKLDFLMQELNREVNTIAAKSIDSEISEAAVELKVLIEQVREQVQNLV